MEDPNYESVAEFSADAARFIHNTPMALVDDRVEAFDHGLSTAQEGR